MIYISEHQLKQVEYLIQQSIQGNHILFDAETVRRVFKPGSKPGVGSPVPVQSHGVENLIESLILEPTIEDKKRFLEKLDSQTHEKVVRTYFNIVENKLHESITAAAIVPQGGLH